MGLGWIFGSTRSCCCGSVERAAQVSPPPFFSPQLLIDEPDWRSPYLSVPSTFSIPIQNVRSSELPGNLLPSETPRRADLSLSSPLVPAARRQRSFARSQSIMLLFSRSSFYLFSHADFLIFSDPLLPLQRSASSRRRFSTWIPILLPSRESKAS